MKLTLFICLLLASLNGNALAATKDSNKIAIQKCEIKYKTDVIKKNACIAKIKKTQTKSNSKMAKSTKTASNSAIQKCETKYKTDAKKKKACIAKVKKTQKMSTSKAAKNDTPTLAILIKQCEKKYKKDSKKKDACIAKVKKEKVSKQQASQLAKQQKTMKSTKAVAKGKTSLTQVKQASGKTLKSININTSTAEEIAASLPGVGATKAKAIVDYRQQYGKFKSASDLANVKGLGKKSVAKMKAYLQY